jgi:RNA polymerase subunit RPABC4/transcription elongation factor Spt4
MVIYTHWRWAQMARKKKDKKKKNLEELLKENEGLVCVNCRTPVPGNTNLCPKCGMNPGVQTITDVYMPGTAKRLEKDD